jgi:LemA protein
MTSVVITLGVVAVVGLWTAVLYNGLIRAKNTCDEAWSDIETELKRRYNLIPNLIETVKGYAAHERETLNAVIEARNRALDSTGRPAEQARDENALVGTLRQLFALAENYPQLKANQNFLKLQEELANTEDRIQAARRFYNANVRDFNNRLEVFPSNIIAQWLGFERRDYFEIEDAAVREVPKVQF